MYTSAKQSLRSVRTHPHATCAGLGVGVHALNARGAHACCSAVLVPGRAGVASSTREGTISITTRGHLSQASDSSSSSNCCREHGCSKPAHNEQLLLISFHRLGCDVWICSPEREHPRTQQHQSMSAGYLWWPAISVGMVTACTHPHAAGAGLGGCIHVCGAGGGDGNSCVGLPARGAGVAVVAGAIAIVVRACGSSTLRHANSGK
jgi:hypothetical protein